MLSIDTKKKELLGEFFRSGQAYTDGVLKVLDHDFPPAGPSRLIPYGVYDVVRNEGLLLLATGSDTSELATDAIWRWWQRQGRRHYWHASGLLVLCDCGGSNGNRQHRFKEQLHRLFCHLSRAWQGAVLRTIAVARDLAARVHTATGLKLIPEIARRTYEKGQQVSRDFLTNMPKAVNQRVEFEMETGVSDETDIRTVLFGPPTGVQKR